MINIDLLTRPWSGHYPRVEGFEPLISAKIERVSFSRKTGWRASILVDGHRMATSHHGTKYSAEKQAGDMMDAYTKVHYISK